MKQKKKNRKQKRRRGLPVAQGEAHLLLAQLGPAASGVVVFPRQPGTVLRARHARVDAEAAPLPSRASSHSRTRLGDAPRTFLPSLASVPPHRRRTARSRNPS